MAPAIHQSAKPVVNPPAIRPMHRRWSASSFSRGNRRPVEATGYALDGHGVELDLLQTGLPRATAIRSPTHRPHTTDRTASRRCCACRTARADPSQGDARPEDIEDRIDEQPIVSGRAARVARLARQQVLDLLPYWGIPSNRGDDA